MENEWNWGSSTKDSQRPQTGEGGRGVLSPKRQIPASLSSLHKREQPGPSQTGVSVQGPPHSPVSRPLRQLPASGDLGRSLSDRYYQDRQRERRSINKYTFYDMFN